jgi:hypothetical protein
MADKFSFKINGVEIPSDAQYLTANEILNLAKDKGAIPGESKEYILKGSKGDYSGDQKVDLAEDNIFIAVPATPTPVAYSP